MEILIKVAIFMYTIFLYAPQATVAQCPVAEQLAINDVEVCSSNTITLPDLRGAITPPNSGNINYKWTSSDGFISNSGEPQEIELTNFECRPKEVIFTFEITCTLDGSLIRTGNFTATIYTTDISGFVQVEGEGDCIVSLSPVASCGLYITGDSSVAQSGESGTTTLTVNYALGSCSTSYSEDINYVCNEPTTCDAGIISGSGAVIFACVDEFAISTTTGSNGFINYVLHDGDDTNIGTVYASSFTGVFFNDGTLPTSVDLCISAIAGSDQATDGNPDQNGACYDISECASVVFLSEIDILFDQNCIDENMVEVAYTITGGGPEYYLNPSNNSILDYNVVATGGYTNAAVYGETYTLGTFASGTTVNISVNDDGKGCNHSAEIVILSCSTNPCINPTEDELGCTDPAALNYNSDANCDDDSCIYNTSNVWPGDKNNDGIVDQKDVSIIGFLYENGSARTLEHQNIQWYGHPAQDWNDNLPFNGANIKHLDCNGDGIISATDGDAVLENLEETHNEGGSQILPLIFNDTDYQIYLQPIDNLNNGETQLDFNVVFDSKNGNNFNLQGGYFTIDYSNQNTNITNAVMNFTNSWLGNPNTNLVTSYQNFPNFQQIEIGFSKTNGIASIGKGIIGQLTVLVDNQDARAANNVLDFEVIEIGFHNSQGTVQAIEEQLIKVGFGESNCELNWTINEDSPFYNIYQSSGTVETNGFVLIGKEQKINYSANRIRMNTGFKVKAGADFRADNTACSNSSNCDPLFTNYPYLINYVNPNTCTNQIVEEYFDSSSFYFLYIRQGNQGQLYLSNNGVLTYYGSDAGDASLPNFYGTATGLVWECGC